MTLVECAALGLGGLPVVALGCRHLGRADAAAALALDIPFAVALDLVAVAMLALLVPLDHAALASRVGWSAALGVILWQRRAALRPLVALPGRRSRAVMASGLVVALLCVPLSSGIAIWDRPLHAPLVASLGGQQAPFLHVYGAEPLRYHWAGDWTAVILRALSGNRLSAGAALSLAHDGLLVLMALSVALLVIALRSRRLCVAVVAGALLLLQGPLPLHGTAAEPWQGHGYHLLFSLSYRPHVPVALLMMVGLVGMLVLGSVRAAGERPPRRSRLLLACGVVLSLSDETSFGLLGLGLGVALLARPALLARTRLSGVALLAGLGLAAFAANLLWGGALAPGGPVRSVEWLLVGGYPKVTGGQLALWSLPAVRALLVDTAPWLVALALLALLGRARRSLLRGLALMAAAVLLAALLLATHLRVNGSAAELQRMFVAPAIVTLLPALLLLDRLPRQSWLRFVCWVGLLVPAAGTLYWLLAVSPGYTALYREGPDNPWARESTYGIDCRVSTGARLGERPALCYVDEQHHYRYSSCRPIFGAGRPQPPWTMPTLPEYRSWPQLRALEALAGEAELPLICPASGRADAVCARIRQAQGARCRAEGERLLRCTLSAEERAELLHARRSAVR